MKEWSKIVITSELRVHGMAGQILVMDTVLKTPCGKVQMLDGAAGEKSRRELCSLYTDGSATQELISLRI